MFITKAIDKAISVIQNPCYYILNYILFKIQLIQFLEMPKVGGLVLVKNRGSIKIGKNMIISSSRYGNPVGCCEKAAFFCSPNGRIVIGDYVSMSSALIFSQESITIEDYVMIGGGCQIWDTDFHPMNLNDRIKHDISKIRTKPVLLKRGCFIGANSIILKGCTIGENSIIGAGSVVTKNVPDNEVWGGNPAVFQKKAES